MISRTVIFNLFLIAALTACAAIESRASDEPEDAPIIERQMDFYDLALTTVEGKPFRLSEYVAGKKLIIVSFAAGWCPNSNRNGHVLKRLFDKYGTRGLGAVVVMEYSNAEESRTHINRIGIDYPVVVETEKRDARKKSFHYKYRQSVGDKRKWGTPFYVIIDAGDLETGVAGGRLARRVFTVSGEIIEPEAEAFIERHISSR
jgi:Redoxin